MTSWIPFLFLVKQEVDTRSLAEVAGASDHGG